MLKFLKSMLSKKPVVNVEVKRASASASSAHLESTKACSETMCSLHESMIVNSQMESAAKRHITKSHAHPRK